MLEGIFGHAWRIFHNRISTTFEYYIRIIMLEDHDGIKVHNYNNY